MTALDLRRRPSSGTVTLGKAEAVGLSAQRQLLGGLTQASLRGRGVTLCILGSLLALIFIFSDGLDPGCTKP